MKTKNEIIICSCGIGTLYSNKKRKGACMDCPMFVNKKDCILRAIINLNLIISMIMSNFNYGRIRETEKMGSFKS